MGLLIASGLRLLPSFNRILTSYQKIGYNKSVINLLNQELLDADNLSKTTFHNKNLFKRDISFKSLEYSLRESGRKILKQLLIPRFHGSYEIPPINFCYFDVNKKKYQTLSHPGFNVKVNKAISQNLNNSNTNISIIPNNQEEV